VVFWLIIAIAAVAGEMFTLSFYLIYEAAAAVVTGLLAPLLPVFFLQVLVFLVASVLSVFVLRPATINYLLRMKPRPTTQYPDLVGRHATVREEVTATGGLIDLGGGEFWSARSLMPDRAFAVGSRVEVAFRDGVRLVVDDPSLDAHPSHTGNT
jgi:membrane protein implicated in regulation of membrane protease activity